MESNHPLASTSNAEESNAEESNAEGSAHPLADISAQPLRTPPQRSAAASRTGSPVRPGGGTPQRRTPLPAATPDIEAGAASRARHLLEWIEQAKPIDPAILGQLANSSDLTENLIKLAKQRATEQAEANRPRYDGDSWPASLTSAARNTTAWTDLKQSGEFRELLRGLEVIRPEQGGSAHLTLDVVRDVFTSLKKQINELGKDDGLAGNPDLAFMQKKANANIDALITSLGSTAYDRVGMDRAARVAAVAATLVIGALPFTYASESQPRADYYLGGLGAAYSRTLMLAVGLMRSPTITLGQIGQNVRERQAIWALPAFFYAVSAFAQAYSTNNPENKAAQHTAANVGRVEAGPGFLAAVGVAEALIFLSLNHPNAAASVVNKPGEWLNSLRGKEQSAETRFARGEMRIRTSADDAQVPRSSDEGQVPTPEERLRQSVARIRDTTKLGFGLAGSLDAAADKWEGKLSLDDKRDLATARKKEKDGRALSEHEQHLLTESKGHFAVIDSSQTALLTETREAMGRLSNTLEKMVGQINESVALIDAQQRREKKLVGSILIGTGAALGTIASIAAVKVPALLTDYIPYYAATELLLAVKTFKDDTHQAKDVARIFGSYYGGTVLGIPPNVGNLASILSKGDGLFDLVALHNPHSPALPLAHDPKLHLERGEVNFGLLMAYNVITSLLASGKAGQFISDKIIGVMKQTVELDNDQSHGQPNFDPVTLRQLQGLFKAVDAAKQEQAIRESAHRLEEIPDAPAHSAPGTPTAEKQRSASPIEGSGARSADVQRRADRSKEGDSQPTLSADVGGRSNDPDRGRNPGVASDARSQNRSNSPTLSSGPSRSRGRSRS